MWPYEQPLLANPALKPTTADLLTAEPNRRRCCRSGRAARCCTSARQPLIQQKLTFPNSGPNSTPGVIVMRIDDTVGHDVDRQLTGLVIVFNATPNPTSQTVTAVTGQHYILDPIQASSSDPVVRTASFNATTGTFTVPARTVAVFIARQH